MYKTLISWTNHTWNFLVGCTKCAGGCLYCFAAGIAARFSGPGLYAEGTAKHTPTGANWTGIIRVMNNHMDDPLHWRKPSRIFVNSMSDTFHEGVPLEVIDRAFDVMERAPWHTFLVLTKRSKRMLEYVSARYKGRKYPDHIWLGVSVCEKADLPKVMDLIQSPASVRFLSCEPLIGPLTLPKQVIDGIQWVIVGGESGVHSRPMRTEWATSLRDQCQNAGIAYFFKQYGSVDANGIRQRGHHWAGHNLLNGRKWEQFPTSPSPVSTTAAEVRS